MSTNRGAAISPESKAGWLVWAVGFALIATLAAKAGDVFAGLLPDNDDLLRLQQIRDLLAGGAWFNVDQARFLTPEGGDLHWSRLPDLVPAAIIWLTTPLLGAAKAEALAATLWPLILLAAFFAALILACRRLGLSPISQAIALGFVGLSAGIYNFWPGRIDHHGFVVTLTMIGFAAALSPRMTTGSAILGALCITMMLSIAIESLPYAAVLICIFGLNWIVRGHREGVRLTAFGLSLAFFAGLFYILDAPGIGAARTVCDAYGTSHMAGLIGGGVLLASFGIFGGALMNWRTRLTASIVAGLLTLLLVVLVQPSCLGDPYADVPDQVKLAWLGAVSEARSITTVLENSPREALWFYGFVLVGLLAALLMYREAPNDKALARGSLILIMSIAALATLWQVRGVTFSHIFGGIGTAWLIGRLATEWWNKRGAGPALVLFVGAIFASPIAWKVMSGPAPVTAQDGTIAKPYKLLCMDPEAYQPLVDQAPMAIFSPIDLGMSVLARTPHSVFAGPYHRNVKGIERVTGVFIGPETSAQMALNEMGATHFLYCQGLPETARYAQLWPEGFAAELERGAVPEWLIPVDAETETDGVVRLYEIAG